jgi:hypothetical protein
MRWDDLNLFATEHLVLSTPLSAEECQARLKGKLRPRYWWRMPSTGIYPVSGSVSPTGFNIRRSQRRNHAAPIVAVGQFEPEDTGTSVAMEIRLKRSVAIYWSMVTFLCLVSLIGVVIAGVLIAAGAGNQFTPVGLVFMLMFLAYVLIVSMAHGIILARSKGTGQFLKQFVSQLLESGETRAWRTRW